MKDCLLTGPAYVMSNINKLITDINSCHLERVKFSTSTGLWGCSRQ